MQRLTWIALLAIFGLALAPSVSHALHAGDASNPFAEICSAAGAKQVPGAPGGFPAASSHLDHCPLCAQAGSVLGMPPAPVTLALPALREAALVTAPVRVVLRSPGWPSAQPRAPPTFS